MHKLFALLSLLLLFNPLSAQPAYQPQAGDILFQDLDCGPYCESIEKVTEGIDGADFRIWAYW